MQLEDVFKKMIRPKILLDAAKVGLKTYSRDRDLNRIFGGQSIPQPRRALQRLIRQETELEEERLTGNAAYDLKFHVQVMTALLKEFHLIPKENHKPF